MSQRWIITDQYNIMTGWDRPLQYHFLCVYDKDDCKVYSNLDDPRNITGAYGSCRGMTLHQVEGVLEEELGILLPAKVRKLLTEDKRTNAGNIKSYHNADGLEVENVGTV